MRNIRSTPPVDPELQQAAGQVLEPWCVSYLGKPVCVLQYICTMHRADLVYVAYLAGLGEQQQMPEAITAVR